MSAPATAPNTEAADRSLEDRGHTHIRDQVVERIAAVAVGEVPAVQGGQRDAVRAALGRRQRARVQATTRGDRVTCAVDVTLVYPTPIRQAAADIRRRVADRVQSLTGMHVVAVDVSVTELSAVTRRRVR